ncbi:uncharacterized protein LOC106665603 [Cimex lectularius]|uniref:Uncharacterized protein n=1 Tax=Cimex lectularius TaxID=79782 RepID=A0A8I6RP92_CIMLE|nr:uncharacterized protein LOC106665603 [Cimex lectularius]
MFLRRYESLENSCYGVVMKFLSNIIIGECKLQIKSKRDKLLKLTSQLFFSSSNSFSKNNAFYFTHSLEYRAQDTKMMVLFPPVPPFNEYDSNFQSNNTLNMNYLTPIFLISNPFFIPSVLHWYKSCIYNNGKIMESLENYLFLFNYYKGDIPLGNKTSPLDKHSEVIIPSK